MRITNMLQFTEQHRYYVYRNFGLSPLDYKMLSHVYQPMVGAAAIGVYQLLFQQLPADQVGHSPLELQRRLFLALDLEPSESGRRHYVEQCTRLEAIGLLHTARRILKEQDEPVYEYHLQPPLLPDLFFTTQHLVLLLRDKLGKYGVLQVRELLQAPEPEALASAAAGDGPEGAGIEHLTVPFYEWFRLNTHAVDQELEQALAELAPAKAHPMASGDGSLTLKKYSYSDIWTRTAKSSPNRPYIEQLGKHPERLAEINYVASKYELTLTELCRLLHEEGVFDGDGEVRLAMLQHRASLLFMQTHKRDEEREISLGRREQAVKGEEAAAVTGEHTVEPQHWVEVPPLLQSSMDAAAYNRMLRNEPYTTVLKRFFPKGVVPRKILDAFDRIDLAYKLNESVINVLIHHIHSNNLSWAGSFIDTVAGDMLGKQVDSYEAAVGYVRDKTRAKKPAAAAPRGRPPASGKQHIPKVTPPEAKKPLSDADIQRIMEKAKRLDGGSGGGA